MLRIICISIVIFFAFSVTAQDHNHDHNSENTEHNHKKERDFFVDVGLNGTYIVSQFLNNDRTDSLQSPYFLTLKLGMNHHALRFGFGGKFNSSQKSVEGFLDTTTDEFSRINLRLGYEYQYSFSEKWVTNFGLDFILLKEKSQLVSDTGIGQVDISTKTSGQGGGAILGLQYQIKNKFWVGVESAFYFLQSNTKSETTHTNFPQLNSAPEIDDKTDFINRLPATLYLILHF